MPTTLESLLEPIGRSEFRELYYGKQPLVIRGRPDKFSGLFTWEDLNRLLNASSWPRPEVELLPGNTTPESPEAIIEQCRAGASLVFSQIHLFDPKVGEFVRALEAETGEPANAVLFLSQPTKAAYPLHYDRHDVFVVQVYGHKAWEVYDRTVERPVHTMEVEAHPPSRPLLEFELAPGDVLYLPRGHWHRALAQRGLSMHLTVGLKARTNLDFLKWLVEESQNDVRLRHELPLSFADEPEEVRGARLREHLAGLEEIFLSRLRDPANLPSFVRHGVVSDRDVRPFKFPTQLFQDPGTALEVRHFSRPARQRAVVSDGPSGDKVALSVWGNIFLFPAAARPLLEFIVSNTTFGFEDALAHAGDLNEQGIWNVLNALLREGILDDARGA